MRKKGFTLIELLAVIVILAVIVLVATPMILGVIESSKKGSLEASVTGILNALETKQVENEINADGYYQLKDFGPLEIKGTKPEQACITIENSNIVSGSFQFKDQVVDYQNGKATLNSVKKYAECITEKSTNDYFQDGLLLHYDSFVPPIGNTWYDLSGNAHGTLIGFQETMGWKQGEMQFGPNSYIAAKEINVDYVTVSAYFKINKETTEKQYVVCNYELGGYGIDFDLDNRNQIQFLIYASGDYRRVEYLQPYQLDTWYHVTGTYDGTTMKLYVNGDLVGQLAISGTIRQPNMNTILMINANPKGNEAQAISSAGIELRNVKIYDQVLSAEQVKQNYDVDVLRYK